MENIKMILSLLCGVALFLYGMSVMGDGLKKVRVDPLPFDEFALKRIFIRNGSNVCYSVFQCDNGYGCRFCKCRNNTFSYSCCFPVCDFVCGI